MSKCFERFSEVKASTGVFSQEWKSQVGGVRKMEAQFPRFIFLIEKCRRFVKKWFSAGITRRFFPDKRMIRCLGKFLSLLVSRRAQSPFRKVQVVISAALYHRTPNRTSHLWRELLRMLLVYIRCEFGKSRLQSYAEFNS